MLNNLKSLNKIFKFDVFLDINNYRFLLYYYIIDSSLIFKLIILVK